MKPALFAATVAAASLLAPAAQAWTYASHYGGSSGRSQSPSAYNGGGYGYYYQGNGSGYRSGYYGSGGGTDAPHRNTWRQIQRLQAQVAAQAYAMPPCGQYDRKPLACRMVTTAYNPSVHGY